MKDKGQVFEIRTLRDIFNLPSIRQVEDCLKELMVGMLQARALNDLAVAAANKNGIAASAMAMEWPEVIEWKDDGEGRVETRFEAPDGSMVSMVQRVKQDAKEGGEA